MTKMTLVKDTRGFEWRHCRQSSQTTCGPASCLMMWANVHLADPQADEAGVIALSRMFPNPWNQKTGADIANLTQVLRHMGLDARHESYTNGGRFLTALHDKVHARKPALAFAEWEVASTVVGHFAVIAAADAGADLYSVLDPAHGLQQPTGMPFYYPVVDGDDPPVLKFTGAVAFIA
jgi:hypothetical protein